MRSASGPHALSAAAEVQKGLDRQLYTLALKSVRRDAILAVLEDPPAGLEEFRDACTRSSRPLEC